MAAPPKPWESGPDGGPSGGSESLFNAAWTNGSPAASNGIATDASKPPPLPPRPGQVGNQALTRSPYGTGLGYSSLGSYGMGSYGSPYSMMGGYGGFGSYGYSGFGSPYGMNRFGYGGGYGDVAAGGDQNDFIRLAEESSRQAFQSIESIVHAFGSVAMMLESTYFAVHSSFRAVLGVAEHFTRMKGQFAAMVSSLAIIRSLHWFVRRLAYLIGLSQTDPNTEAIWREAGTKAAEFPLTPEGVLDALTSDDGSRGKSSWPIMIFFAVVCGTPWLIWKLLSKITGKSAVTGAGAWVSGQADHYLAEALYDFEASSPKEISFRIGQQIMIAPRDEQPRIRGWLLATVDGNRVGLVPAPYLKMITFQPMQATRGATISDFTEPKPSTSKDEPSDERTSSPNRDNYSG